MRNPTHSCCTLLALAALATAAAAQPSSITTLIASNNARSTPGSTSMFDITVTNPDGIRIVAFDVNSTAVANQSLTIDVYITPTTYVGKELNPAPWLKVSSGTGTTAGRELATFIDVGDFFLPAGSYGIGIHYTDNGNAYTNGTGGNQAYSNADVSLQLGVTTAGLFSSTLFNPRVWNGTIYYATRTNATHGTLGAGCTGTAGVPLLAAAPGSLPRLGTTYTLNASNLPATPGAAVLLLGFNKQNWASNPLPLDLTGAGMTGCSLYINFLLTFPLAVPGGSGSLPLPVPNDQTLLGAPVLAQVLGLDPGANPLGATLSNATEGQVGQ